MCAAVAADISALLQVVRGSKQLSRLLAAVNLKCGVDAHRQAILATIQHGSG
jgi:hypothetical protein